MKRGLFKKSSCDIQAKKLKSEKKRSEPHVIFKMFKLKYQLFRVSDKNGLEK